MNDDPYAARLLALQSYQIIDTPSEAGFDDIVAMASQICEAPVALVSLVERDRQWFKASVGVDMCETPISQSVCAHGLAGTELLVIPDLSQDARTCTNTLVTGDPHIRFYAGAPLVTPAGVTIGMLCVIDLVPRPQVLTEHQAETLSRLARQVIAQLELRKTLRLLEESDRRSRIAEEAGGIGTFELDVVTNMLTVSPEFCRLFGLPVAASYPAETIEAQVVSEHAAVHSNRVTRADGSAAPAVEYRIRALDGAHERWLSRRGEFKRDPSGVVTHMFGTVHDITEQRLLNMEIEHRLKNTIALVQALAVQSLRRVSEREPVLEFEARLRALGSAHDVLVECSRSAAPLGAIAEASLSNLGLRDRTTLSGPEIELASQAALAFSMLVHELATNAIKYGAFLTPDGEVEARWRIEGDDLVFDWQERGGPPPVRPERKGFGSRLIETGLSSSGSVDIRYEPAGLSATVRAPIAQISV